MSLETTAAAAAAAAASAAVLHAARPPSDELDAWLLIGCVACGLYGALRSKPGNGRAELVLFISSVLASVVIGYVAGQAFGIWVEQRGVRVGVGDRLVGCLVSMFALRVWDWASALVPDLIRVRFGILPPAPGNSSTSTSNSINTTTSSTDGGNSNAGQ